MVRQVFSNDEVAERGERLYRDQLQTAVEPGNVGRFLVMDILSGDYEIDDRDIAATNRLEQRRPDGILYGLRIGYPAAYRLGRAAA